MERGITTVTYDPEAKNKRIDVTGWLELMGKTKHLLKEESGEMLQEFREEVERRCKQLKAKHESPYL